MISYLELANSLPKTRLNHADHELITLTRRWLVLQHELEELEAPFVDTPHYAVPGAEAVFEKVAHVEQRLEKIAATTIEGARARLLMACTASGFWWTPAEEVEREVIHMADALAALSSWTRSGSAAANHQRMVSVTRAVMAH